MLKKALWRVVHHGGLAALARWRNRRRLLVVTYKKSDSIGFWDLEAGAEIDRLPTTRRIPHGVAITSDGRYSFVTVEGVGGEPGVVEIFDNRIPARVGTVNVGKQAGGIALWERGG